MKICLLKEDFILSRRNSLIILKTFKVLKNYNDREVNAKLLELNSSLQCVQRNYFELSVTLMNKFGYYNQKLNFQYDPVTSDLIKKLLEEQDDILDKLTLLVEKTKCFENLRTELRLLIYNLR